MAGASVAEQAMRIAEIPVVGGAPLVLISGLNVLETAEGAVASATALRLVARRHRLPLVFKASFDKANRSSGDSYRGPGIDAGLEMLALSKEQVLELREEHAIYMAGSGRINIAGLTMGNIDKFIGALRAVTG